MGNPTNPSAPKIIPGPVRTAEDLLTKVPDEIKRKIIRQLELEELEEFLRKRGNQ